MKNKKLFFILITVLIIILISLFFIIRSFIQTTSNDKLFSDYTPEEEISASQMRKTTVTLYFISTNNELKCEGRLIDSALLINNPYKELVELLISGPKTDGLVSVFPNNTNILDASIENNQVILNFSNDLLNYENNQQKYNIINCLLNTLAKLNEVDSVKILINNQENENFDEEYHI